MNDTENLREFCRDALGMMGAEVADADGLMSVSVPASALDLFEGRPSLQLAFRPEDVDDGVELVVPGSYVLERLIESVRMRGELTSIGLDAVAQASPSPGMGLANAEARLVSSQTAFRDLLLVNFRVSLVSDEDHDRLFRVLIDLATGEQANIDPTTVLTSAGRGCPIDGIDAGPALQSAFERARTAAMDFAREWSDSAQQKIDARLATEITRLEQYYQDVLADAAHSKGGDTLRIQKRRERTAAAIEKLDRRYQMARQLLGTDDTLDQVEATFNSRLAELNKERKRLVWTTDYQRKAQCDAEILALRKGNEIARHIVHSTDPADRLAKLEEERQKALSDLRKQREGKETAQSDPDALAHLQDLGKQLESEKAQRIAELQDKFQLKVAIAPVSASLIRYPQAEYRYEALSGSASIAFTSHQDLVTGAVKGPECQSCHGEMATGHACSCGHIACDACHKTCAGCGKDLCSSCVTGACQVCGGTVCETCRTVCQVCGKLACPSHATKCAECGKTICKGAAATCARTCQICGGEFCPEHAATCPVCGSMVCSHEMRTCAVCGIRACRIDVADCPSCGKAVCPAHSTACSLCGQRVCGDCVGGSGYCRTCEGLFPASSSLSAIEQLIPDGRGRWLVNESRDAYVLVRKGLKMRAYVVDKATGKLRSERTLGLFDSIRARCRLNL